MEQLLSADVIKQITEFIDLSKKDKKAEFECKILSKEIVQQDVADRILERIGTLSMKSMTQENRMTLSYKDGTRVNVVGIQRVFDVCNKNSFKDVPVLVEKKKLYFEDKKSEVYIQDFNTKFTLRSEEKIRDDWTGVPNDSNAYVRIMSRKSFKTLNQLFQIDFSIVKTKPLNSTRKIIDVIQKDEGEYELEIEFIDKKTTIDTKLIVKDLLNTISSILQAYRQSPFLIANSKMQEYAKEFEDTKTIMWDIVTLEKRHMDTNLPINILKDYTVTIKADGLRCGLYVASDGNLLLVRNRSSIVTWTGIFTKDKSYVGTFVDGEYIPEKNLFCIFDVYRYKTQNIRSLPLLTTDEDILKDPKKCRLGYAKIFVDDLSKNFTMSTTGEPLQVQTKLFLAGDGIAMQEAINKLLDTKYDYETDGIIFTPRSSAVAPKEDTTYTTWNRVYKWKPPHQNSIDFLVRLDPAEVFDPVTAEKSRKGELLVTLTPEDYFIKPREQVTGEYVPPPYNENDKKIPAIFQPSKPKDENARVIYIPISNTLKQPVDQTNSIVKDNTIIECSYDVEKRRWIVMRTRYDKTYQYRMSKRNPNYGNRYETADNIWTSIHIPITEETLRNIVTNPPDDTYFDSSYYNDSLNSKSKQFNDITQFHTAIKYDLYIDNVKEGDTLLELASGRDIEKWLRVKPSKVVALDIVLLNFEAPKGGACVRYLKAKRDSSRAYVPPVLFLEGDMTVYPLFEQEDPYMPIVRGEKTGSTPYLGQFENLQKYDVISCQFAMHYACKSEETFRAFAKNIGKYGSGVFIGTCSDGASIYSLLLGKKSHLFMMNKKLVGKYEKEYEDRQNWTDDEFGLAVKVMLETFDRPSTEWLVPWKKVTEIMDEEGWQLEETHLFSELYPKYPKIVHTEEQQTFSALNRSFVFKKGRKPKPEPEPEPEPEKKEEEKPKEEQRKRRRLKKGGDEPEPEPILFDGADESKGEYRYMSNDAEYPMEVDGKKYPTVEHYYQAMKAETFEDKEVFDKLLVTKTPKAAKAQGKTVKNFIKEVWDSKREAIMEKGVRAKFTQHPELRKKLLETGDKVIGKADGRNTFWGIGSSMVSDKSKVPSKWRGQNKLGKILMELRDVLKDETN